MIRGMLIAPMIYAAIVLFFVAWIALANFLYDASVVIANAYATFAACDAACVETRGEGW